MKNRTKNARQTKKKRKEKEGKVERPRKTTLAWQARAPKKDRLKHFSQLKRLELKKKIKISRGVGCLPMFLEKGQLDSLEWSSGVSQNTVNIKDIIDGTKTGKCKWKAETYNLHYSLKMGKSCVRGG